MKIVGSGGIFETGDSTVQLYTDEKTGVTEIGEGIIVGAKSLGQG